MMTIMTTKVKVTMMIIMSRMTMMMMHALRSFSEDPITMPSKTVTCEIRYAMTFIGKIVTGLINSKNSRSRKNTVDTGSLFLPGKTLAGSWSVVSKAHIQPFTLLMVLELSRSRSVDHDRLPDKHMAKHSHKNLHTCGTPWSALQKKGCGHVHPC